MEYLKNLNEEQIEAVTTIDGPVLVLAGAGSGKTRVVTSRIIHLIKSGIAPSHILGLTFTNKAAQEMKDRVNKLTQNHVWISTFHSLGVRILRESIGVLGYQRDFVIYDEDDSEKLLRTCLSEMGEKEKKGDARAIRALISKVKNNLINADYVDTESLSPSFQDKFPAIYERYVARCKECNAVDFDDLLYLPVKLFREFPEVLEHYQQRFRYLLIDEYQDTNEAQYTLVNSLVEKSHNVFVVGDPDQSIYSWRGANLNNILHFERDYAGAKVVRLERNYRSRSNILQAANDLISNNLQRFKKNLWSDLGEGAKIRRFSGYDEQEEARFVARRLRFHHEEHGIPYNQMVVFYRTNAQSRPLEDQLLSVRLPYTIVGGISFYHRKEIKDILAFLRLIHSSADYIAFARTINIPKRGIGDATLDKLASHAMLESLPILNYVKALTEKQPLKHSAKLSSKALEGLRQFSQMLDEFKLQAQTASLKDLVVSVIEKSHYLDFLALEEKETFEERKENLDELIAKAIEWEYNSEEPTLEGFLEELSLKSSLDESTGERERINLMTIHNGKGLEFTVTFLVGMEEDLFPHANSRESEAAVEEERRLCYVGMTRAKEYLYLTSSQMRYMWGSQRFQRPSRFLLEIGPHFLERVSMA
ncbi:ATP-dependent DNA helicase PcrA [Chlamydiales bacterium STE3]|nr:ATP-dependent DNA helicase PcrA [Chlamydiales bacterium STE3]